MNKSSVLGLVLFFMMTYCVQGQNVIGKWKSIDDETGQAKSIIEIVEKSGKLYGKIIEILDPAKRDKICVSCSGDDKNKPILGMMVIRGLTKDGNEYNSGEILDPTSGKIYKCFITLDSKDRLKVRGYIGVALFGRTQYWFRVKS